jgi:tRNA A22 N-methylase
MKTLRELNDRINQLQQIIDTEQQDADAGCDWSRSLIINAEIEKEEICDAIDQLAMANCLFI